jgi:sarcosine oxidase, subunit alpha
MRFTFDGTPYEGLPGDTLAAALLRNGVDVVARSIYRGRPRGVYAAGADEPNALVQVELDGASEPMLRATEVELFDGLVAEGLNGRGRLSADADPVRCDHVYAHCDLLVVGGGPAGLAAADAAARTDARVILVDDQPELGGSLIAGRDAIDGEPAAEWIAGVRERLDAAPEVRVLTRASAIGYYDANLVVVAERRRRLWQIRARRVVLATGAHERAPVFAGNDRPGIMLASAARTYVNRFAVPGLGSRAVVFTTNDSGLDAAEDLRAAGIEVAEVVDARDGRAVVGTVGDERVAGVDVMDLGDGGAVAGERVRIGCDLLAVSGGWNPAVELFSQAGGRLRYDAALACFVPDGADQALRCAGACAGTFDLAGCLADGTDAGAEAVALTGAANGTPPRVPRTEAVAERPPRALWLVPAADGESWDEHFADLQRDATVADIRRAAAAGMRSPEHVKRFTTIGTANDQGRTGGVTTLGVLAATLGVDISELGPTTFRPPYVPVRFGLLAGRNRGELHDPIRMTPIHPWHVEHGAVFEDVGQWKRPWFYPRAGEDMDAAVLRECAAAREGVAMMDATTLGKIDVVGPDAVEFLNRLYTGDFSKLKPGMCKYGLLCHADGMVFDDGVSMRLAEDRFLVTTTTGNAAAVLDWFEEWLQTEWPDLRVRCTSVTEQWSTVAIVGPRSRDVVGALTEGIDVSQDAFPWMAISHGTAAGGIPARVCRVSFSGELAYEVNVAGRHGLELWEAAMAAGEPYGITPYGTETMHVLRAEKGYVIVGQDTDGTVTPHDLGLSWMVSKTKGDFVGRRSFARPDTARGDRKHLVGLLAEDPDERLPEGAQLVLDPDAPVAVPMAGHVTSSYRSAALGRTFALALLKRGRERVGETVFAPLGDRTVPVLVTDPVFYDPEGARRDG